MTIATVWLGGCSGCHMSLLDLDERLFDLLKRADIVGSPLSGGRDLPDRFDILLVEGAAAQKEHIAALKDLRKRAKTVVAFGDCAVVGNVTAMRNVLDTRTMLHQTFGASGTDIGRDPALHLPVLLDRVVPLHRVIDIDVFLPGCPPSADLIWYVLTELLEGRIPELDRVLLRYG